MPDPEARLRRAVELAYGVDGVVAARVWRCESDFFVGVVAACGPDVVLRAVTSPIAGLAQPEETWSVGLLQDPLELPCDDDQKKRREEPVLTPLNKIERVRLA